MGFAVKLAVKFAILAVKFVINTSILNFFEFANLKSTNGRMFR